MSILVAVLRHPDASNIIEVSAGGQEVHVVGMDLGSNFDGYPRNEEEASVALDMAAEWEKAVAMLPDSPARRLVLSTVDEMRGYAADAGIGLCDECGGKYNTSGDGWDGYCGDCADRRALAEAAD